MFIRKGMKKYKIKTVMMTEIQMHRRFLITKEEMENTNKRAGKSTNEDLESLYEDICLGKKPNNWGVTYFLPKLTEEEMTMVENKDPNYFATFSASIKADVEPDKMNTSESDSKFVCGFCTRRTSTVEREDSSPKNCCEIV